MSEPFIGEIRMFCGSFAPRGWQFCSGQILPISQNTALFSILGTTYGGNGQTTFALPDLRGRAPLNQGQGPGLSSYSLGEASGSEAVTLTVNQLPAHNHLAACNSDNASAPSPANNFPAAPLDSTGANGLGYAPTGGASMAAGAILPVGNSMPVSVLQPLLCVSFIIALEGIYPSRN